MAGEGGETVVHRRIEPTPATGGEPADWRLGLDLDVPAGVDRVAVLVEDLPSGLWGGTLAGLVPGGPGAPAAAGDEGGDLATAARGDRFDADLGLLPAPRVVNLVQPKARMVRGAVPFETVVSDPAVAKVEFRLDGRKQAVAERAPFRAVLDLGSLPLRRRVDAVAYDAAGKVLGRDSIIVNEGGRSFAVRITEPLAERRVGPVDVAAEVTHPEGDKVDRVEFFWNDQRVATLFRPPYRYRLNVPADAPRGSCASPPRWRTAPAPRTSASSTAPAPAAGSTSTWSSCTPSSPTPTDRPVKGIGADDFSL